MSIKKNTSGYPLPKPSVVVLIIISILAAAGYFNQVPKKISQDSSITYSTFFFNYNCL